MPENTVPIEYLLNDPQPDHVPKNPRLIDHDTLSDLIDILNGLIAAAEMVAGTAGCKKLQDQIGALISIVKEGQEGGRS